MIKPLESFWTETDLKNTELQLVNPHTSEFFNKLTTRVEQMQKDPKWKKRFGKNIRLVVTVRDINLSNLAKMIGFNHTHVSRVVAGEANSSVHFLIAVSMKLSVRPTVLLEEDLSMEMGKLLQ